MALVNHFYIYIRDPEWGPAFIKTSAYAPWPIWIYLNGHEWAKRQCEKAHLSYVALDNGFRSCDDPKQLQRTCDRLGPGAVHSFFWRWCHRLPSPFTRSHLRHGYPASSPTASSRCPIPASSTSPSGSSILRGSHPRDHLDVGRPDRVAIIFGRKVNSGTPGSSRTEVITRGVDPQVSCCYQSSRLKQYFKEHRPLRAGLVISGTRDFGIGRRVTAEA